MHENLEANRFYEIVEGASRPRQLGGGAPSAAVDQRERMKEFWSLQRAAMNALKLEKDAVKAGALFVQALALDPTHEDSRYYLAQCLADQGSVQESLNELRALQTMNPQSHRAFQQFGKLRANFAESPAHLAEAEASLRRAREINPEETGALQLLGEVQLLSGNHSEAESSFAAICATNPRAAAAFFLRGYLAWKQERSAAAAECLKSTRVALGPEWQPKGATAEGDVTHKQHSDLSPLRRFLDEWNGAEEPSAAFGKLDQHLAARRSSARLSPQG
jgi:tetratricopeptide (TPR) repeat protein